MDNKSIQPHCDMFSLLESCPECGNEDNEKEYVCDMCGCIWTIKEDEKTVVRHGKLYKG